MPPTPVAWIADARRDCAYALRSLRRSRTFAAAAILTLSVGIGATTAIYSVVDTVLLQPLALPNADRVVRLVENQRHSSIRAVDYQEYLDWRARTTTLSALATATLNPQVMLPTDAGTLRVTGGSVSTNYFEVLGAQALLGRTIVSSDDRMPDVAVLSFGLWRRSFRSDPNVVGSRIEVRSGNLAGRLLTIVGVMPESMETIGAPMEFYTPILLPGAGVKPPILGPLIGRLRDGVSLAAASDEANALGNAIRAPRPASAPPLTGPRFAAQELKDDIVAGLRPALRVFLTAVAVVLLIVCANVANLLLARGAARRREIAVRLAVGATRGRLVRQLLAECVVLAAAGAVFGGMLGAAGVALVKRLATIESQGVFRIVFGVNLLPRANEVAIDLRLFAIALVLASITTIVFGLFPAIHLARTGQTEALASRGGGTLRRDTRARTALAIGQLALATVLLVGATLLSTSFIHLASVEKGYDPSNVLAFQLVLPDEYSTARKADTIDAILGRVRAIPGVTTAGFAYAGILVSIQDTVGSFVPAGGSLDEIAKDPTRPRLKSVSAGYLDAAGVRLLAGRRLTEADAVAAEPAIVVNRSVARRYFGDANPVGREMVWHSGRGAPIVVRVVGVVDDVRQSTLDREPYAEIFMHFRQVIATQERWGAQKRLVDQLAFGFMSFAMRLQDHPAAAAGAVRQAIARTDPSAGIDAIAPLEQLVSHSMARQRFYAVMLGIFAGVAALLAAIGIYGVLAYAVSQRTQEIGIRMALGADRRQVLALVLRRGLLCAAVGIGLGLGAAAGVTRYLRSMLFGVTPLDAATFVLVAVSFAALAAFASYLPARRAARVEPAITLRSE